MPSLRPHDMVRTIEGLIISTKLPDCSEEKYYLLQFSGNPGVYIINEALRRKPIRGVDQRGLSRYACLLATERLTSHSCVGLLKDDYAKFQDIKSGLPLIQRKRYSDMLFALACGYKPAIKARTNIWFWDTDTKNNVISILTDCGLPMYFIYPFIADVLSEIGALKEISSDLRDEYRQADVCLNAYSAGLKAVLSNIQQV